MHQQSPPPMNQPSPQSQAKPTVWFVFSSMALVWSLLDLAGGIAAVIYLGLGVAMTHTREGVFGPEQGFNWFVLWAALMGQLVGLVISAVVAFMALRHHKRGCRLAKAATVLGFIATAVFLLTGGIQILLLPILRDALSVL